MSEHEHAPPAKSQSATRASRTDPEPKPQDARHMFVHIRRQHRISADVVDVSLDTHKYPVSVGMSGVVLGLPEAKVEVYRVFAGGAKARISLAGVDREIRHHRQVVLEVGETFVKANASNGHYPHDPESRAKLRAKHRKP